MKFVNFTDSVRVGDIFSAKRPKLAKYRFLKFEGIKSKKFAWKQVSEYTFLGSNDLKIWTPVTRALKSFLHAYEPLYDAPFEICEGQMLMRRNPKKGQISKAEVLNKENGFWRVKMLVKHESDFKPASVLVTIGFFRDFTLAITPRHNRLSEVE